MFRSHWLAAASVVLALGLSACKPNYGGVKVNVTLVNDSKTQCLYGWVAKPGTSTSFSNKLPRTSDTYVFGVQGSDEISGEVTVGVNLFTTTDCSGTNYASDTKLVTIPRGSTTTVNFEFRFGGPDDGGMDGGLDDGGVDGGCDSAMCTSPPACRGTPGTCGAGGCQYPLLPEGTDCGDGGVCNAVGQCGQNVCPFRPDGGPCDDGLPCTMGDVCSNFQCIPGICQPPPVSGCYGRSTPPVCGGDGGCVWTPANPNGPCSTDAGATNGRCETTGLCSPWFNVPPSNLPDDVRLLPVPTNSWTATPGSDGGACVIDTSGATPGPRDMAADCGFTGQALVLAQDAGSELAVFRATDLLVPPGVEVQFVGDRPAVLAIFGDATVHGTLSAAARAASSELPAGSGPAACLVPDAGTPSNREGGAGGSYRTQGGRGGEFVLAVGPVNGTAEGIPLRGGCAGAPGGGPTPGDGGIGGGALQLTVMGELTVGDAGVLSVSGAGGFGGLLEPSGAGGGGSGGTLLLEARHITLVNCALTANGGGGGQGGRNGQAVGGTGADGSRTTGTPAAGGNTTNGPTGGNGGVSGSAPTNGGTGGGSQGGGGGGGAVGLIRLNGVQGCSMSGAVRSGELTGTPCN